MMNRLFFAFSFLALAACGSEPGYFGSFDTNFGATFAVDAERVDDGFGGTYTVLSFDDARVVAQNDSSNAFFPDLFSAFDFAEVNSSWYYCQIEFEAATEEAAESATPGDSTAVDTDGCAGFPWTRLDPMSAAVE